MAEPPVKADPGSDEQGFDDANAMEYTYQNLSSDGSNHIDQLIRSSSVVELEAGVQVGIRLLEGLKTALNAYGAGNPQAAQWLQYIQQVEETAKPARTVIGVVGATGAGKSSVINAVLDEERLVPTSGLRACTASATEISYNHSDDPNELYRAEVEFISAEQWYRQLNTHLEDLIDGNGNISRDCNNPDTEAGVAYSKIKAVFPHMTKEQIVRRASDPAAMAQEPSICTVLGSVRLLGATSSADLYDELQQYIDSKEKTSSQMEYWPLIKVVRIYCKAAALSTGLVLVDLPGVEDSNAARSAVSDSYIKVCNGLWITARIDRAVSDKTAQKLFGNSFKRQLQSDGAFSAITFICTKADDILSSEVKDSLKIKDEVGDYWEQIELLDQKRDKLNVQIEDLKKEKGDCEAKMHNLDKSFEEWDDLREKLPHGPVYRPSQNSKKRKRNISAGRRRKMRGSVNDLPDSDDSDESDDVDNSEDSTDGEDTQAPQDQRVPLTKDDIKTELESLKAQKKETRRFKKSLSKGLAQAKMESKYVKDCIKGHFVMGIKELDQELAIEKDEANFDPENEIRNYDEVARNLPVFCVSAHAYQKLAGRLEKDAVQIYGFATLDDTEIPQLQEHAKKLTEHGRISTSLLFLSELNQLLNSMRLWAATSTRTAMSEKDQMVDEKVLRACFMKLENAFRQAVVDCHSSMKYGLQALLYKAFDHLIPVASSSAVETAFGWGKPRSDGGMYWGSYKATCRRNGSWTGIYGSRDFNEELFEPIDRRLAGRWERAFQHHIPSALAKFIGGCKMVLEAFHDDVATNVPGAAANPAGLNMLGQQKRTYQMMLDTTPNSIGAKITETQREANRGFIPVIQEAMEPAYDACARERGPGTFGRMKSTMESHVNATRNNMFRAACDVVRGQLDGMCADVEQWMTVFINDLLTKLQRDYLTTLVGEHAEVTAAVPWAEQMLHGQVWPILEDADSRFAQICFPAGGGIPAAPVGSEQEDEDLIARQLEDVSESDTKPGTKQEPL
ncbi:hypothetical protein INS49_011078 [Diaporthe citri]|uniref:uncharacterized protein n=1 Tax=Diaporthe citri TaxID=83186 RepID=UPI001C827DCA|nr:uncharacterized protein INS49_011078 [Diaporthe citri]KAG6360022.1 hypothetical protein INS49_011078 [Diaporthe citri]